MAVGVMHVPVLADRRVAVADHDDMPRRQLGDARVEGLAGEWRSRKEVIGDAAGIGRAANLRILEKRLDLRRADELSLVEVVVERLDAEPIARAEQQPIA